MAMSQRMVVRAAAWAHSEVHVAPLAAPQENVPALLRRLTYAAEALGGSRALGTSAYSLRLCSRA